MDQTKYYVCLLVDRWGACHVDIFTEPSPTRELDTISRVLFGAAIAEDVVRWFDGPGETKTARYLLSQRGVETLERLGKPKLSDRKVRAGIAKKLLDGGSIIEAIKEARALCNSGLKETKDVADEVRNALVVSGAIEGISGQLGETRWLRGDKEGRVVGPRW